MKRYHKITTLVINLIMTMGLQAQAWQMEVLAKDKIGIGAASSNSYGAIFLCQDKTKPDLVLGGNPNVSFGDDGVLSADPTFVSSDLCLEANDDVVVRIDKNNNSEVGEIKIFNGFSELIYQLNEDGFTTQTGPQAVIALKTTNHTNGSVLDLNNASSSLFNYIGAINFSNLSSTPGQIAYTSSHTMDFKVHNVNPLMQLSNGANHIIMSNGAKLTSGGMWMDVSSRSKKNIESNVNCQNILTALTHLPIYQWRYKTEPNSLHLGPTAEEFYELFGLGSDPESLSPSDLASVAIASIQAIQDDNKNLREEILLIKNEIASIKSSLTQKKRRKKRLKL